MAKQLDYEWNKDWLNGQSWVAIAGDDFIEGEEELFSLWLQQQANHEDKWALTRITRLRQTGVVVIFSLVERDYPTDEPN